MARTSIASFTQAAQQTQQWVNEVADDLGWDENRAYRLLRAVLHTTRDWLTPEEVADLSAQLPLLVRGIYFEGWDPKRSPSADRSKSAFTLSVTSAFGHDADVDLEKSISAVFCVLSRHVSRGEITQVRNSMKKALRQLWPVH